MVQLLCLRSDRKILLGAATSGEDKFFLGTDSAPHFDRDKIAPCGCAGVFSSPVAMEYLVQLFYNHGKIDMLEKFTSINGALFYGMPTEGETVKYKYRNIPNKSIESIQINNEKIYVFNPNLDLHWEKEKK